MAILFRLRTPVFKDPDDLFGTHQTGIKYIQAYFHYANDSDIINPPCLDEISTPYETINRRTTEREST